MSTNFLLPERIKPYQIATEVSDIVWHKVITWGWFEKKTLGAQFVESTDSIAANIAEGFGRYHKKDKQKFFYNSRGSTYEALHWIERAKTRSLISEEKYSTISQQLTGLPQSINWLIKITEEKLER
ncbi:MAG: four helix bundle protein [Candidatus Levybacteria bacterium]|nr:four helix bundle protein [Candidatus Levybacteria bacterium]